MFTEREPPGRLTGKEQSLLPGPPLDPGRARRGGTGNDRTRPFLPDRTPLRLHAETEEGIPWPEVVCDPRCLRARPPAADQPGHRPVRDRSRGPAAGRLGRDLQRPGPGRRHPRPAAPPRHDSEHQGRELPAEGEEAVWDFRHAPHPQGTGGGGHPKLNPESKERRSKSQDNSVGEEWTSYVDENRTMEDGVDASGQTPSLTLARSPPSSSSRRPPRADAHLPGRVVPRMGPRGRLLGLTRHFRGSG